MTNFSQPLDIDLLRRETAGLNPAPWNGGRVHITGAHFNNAGAGLPPICVKEAMEAGINLECTVGGYEAEAMTQDGIQALYDELAKLIGATETAPGATPGGGTTTATAAAPGGLTGAQCIAIHDSSTSAWGNAFYSIPFKAGDVVLTSRVEYGANYVAFLQLARQKGILIEVAPCTSSGVVDVTVLAARLKQDRSQSPSTAGRVRCVAITHIPTNGGVINPCEEIGAVIATHNQTATAPATPQSNEVFYIVDACQSFGQKPLDVKTLHCHFLSAAARKYLRGPRGIGFLYVHPTMMDPAREFEPVTLDHYSAPWDSKTTYRLQPDAQRFERLERCVNLRMGFLAAVRYANNNIGLARSWPRIQMLAAKLRTQLAQIGGQVVVTDMGTTEEQCGICTFTVAGKTATEVVDVLRQKYAFNTSVTKAMSTRLDMEERQLDAMTRASVSYYNTEAEVDGLVKAVAAIASQ